MDTDSLVLKKEFILLQNSAENVSSEYILEIHKQQMRRLNKTIVNTTFWIEISFVNNENY